MLADKSTFSLLMIVHDNEGLNTHLLIEKLGLTINAYHHRMEGLLKTGLLIRIKGRYFITSKGQIVYHFLSKLQNILASEKTLYQLLSIDALLMENYHNNNNHNTTVSAQDKQSIIQMFLTEEDRQVKWILLSPKSEVSE